MVEQAEGEDEEPRVETVGEYDLYGANPFPGMDDSHGSITPATQGHQERDMYLEQNVSGIEMTESPAFG
jgi:hypothetical protein